MLRSAQDMALIGAVATLFGCERSAPDASAIVRDSAGVRIVETSASSRSPASIQVSTDPVLSVGLVDGEPQYLLSRVVGALPLPDEGIVVGDGGTNELRFYDSTGKWQKTAGREGAGPGEFEYMRALGACRENGFVAFDLNWQVNAYDNSGEFVEKKDLRAPDGITPYNLACDYKGNYLLLGWGRSAEEIPLGFNTARDRLVLASSDGEIVQDFGERLVSERIGTEYGSRPHPAGRATLFAIHDTLIYVGSGERFEIELYGVNGELQRFVRGPAVRLSVTDSIKDAYLAWALSRASADREPAIRSDISKWEWPPSVPAYTKLVVDEEGVAWLRAFNFDTGEPETWSLLDPNQGYLGDVTLAGGMTLLHVGRDFILTLSRNDMDVQSVAKYRLKRRLAAGSS